MKGLLTLLILLISFNLVSQVQNGSDDSFFSDVKLDTNIITIHTTASNELLINDKKIALSQLCQSITKPLEVGKGIRFTHEKNTKYHFCLSIYNSVKKCVSTLRDIKSRALYGKEFDLLEQEDQNVIKRMIPFEIVENEPNIFEVDTIESTDQNPIFYVIEPIDIQNDIAKAKLIDEWQGENYLFDFMNKLEEPSTSIDEYKYGLNGSIVFIKNKNALLKIGKQYIVEILVDVDHEFKINEVETIDLEQIQNQSFDAAKHSTMLSKNGQFVDVMYQYLGRTNCSKEDLIKLMKNGFGEESIAKSIKTILRKEIGALHKDDIVLKIQKESIQEAINRTENTCFVLEHFSISVL